MSGMPRWLDEYRKRAKLMDILVKAFETNCDCEVCKMLREWAMELDQSLNMPLPPEEQKKAKKKRKR
jgi:hypothetical protein